jgi:hypothetical protein
MSKKITSSPVLWVAAVGVLGLYFLRRLSRMGGRQRRIPLVTEFLGSPETAHGKIA